MNKQDLVAQVGVRLALSRRASTEVVDAVAASVMRAVAAGEKVTIPGFGTFEKRLRAPRSARNPRTGDRVAVPATSVVVFRPGAEFRQKVAGRPKPSKRR
jgi:DNA-binding protein HU-beta